MLAHILLNILTMLAQALRLALGVFVTLPAMAFAHDSARRETAFTRLRRNLTVNGAVLAAPSGNPEYQFHWTRDAAITMAEVLVRAKQRPSEREKLSSLYKTYIAFSQRMLRSESQAGAGEPKYELDGKPYAHWWGRPQNDGPALRALSNIAFAEWSMKHEGARSADALLGSSHAPGLIATDLAYVYAHWREPSYDLWEEQLGDHFYTRAVQAQALLRGARFMAQMGDESTAAKYRLSAAEIRRSLDAHWDARYHLVRASLNAKRGAEYKWTGLDSSVLLAANHTQGPDSPLNVLDERLLSTAQLLEVDFRNKYEVNHHQRGLLIGRYPEDRYTGRPGEDRDEGGNPWVITTHGFAEYYFRVAAALRHTSSLAVTEVNHAFFAAAQLESLPVGTVLKAGDARLNKLADAVAQKGDAFLAAVRNVVGDGVQTEQIDRQTGKTVGAEELTWNYASYLSAMRARDRAGLPTPQPH